MSPPVELLAAALELAAVEGSTPPPGLLLAAAGALAKPKAPPPAEHVCRACSNPCRLSVEVCDDCWRDGGGNNPWPPEDR